MKIKCVVPVSGGKDSQACLKIAIQTYKEDEVLGLFCDTQFEHPLTYAHIENISQLYGVKIKTINAGNVKEKCIKYKRFPGGGARFCTEELKIIPSKKFYKDFALKNGGFEVWMGMRSDESKERAKRYYGKISIDLYAPNDVLAKYPKYLEKLGVMFRLPIIEWSKKEVFDFLNGEQNILYSHGFDRVGCFPCLAAGDKHKERAFNFDETGKKHYVMVQELETYIGRSVFTSKGGISKQKNSDLFEGCSICAI